MHIIINVKPYYLAWLTKSFNNLYFILSFLYIKEG